MSEPLNGLKSQVQSAPFSFEMVRVEPLPPAAAAPPDGELDPQARFFAADGAGKLVYASAPGAGQLGRRLAGRATVITPGTGTGLPAVLADLRARGIGRLMIEGGASVLGQALSQGLADELLLAVAPVFVADPGAPRLLAGRPLPGRMVLAGLERAGDVAVLRYLAVEQPET